jgi:hypothetical protein
MSKPTKVEFHPPTLKFTIEEIVDAVWSSDHEKGLTTLILAAIDAYESEEEFQKASRAIRERLVNLTYPGDSNISCDRA